MTQIIVANPKGGCGKTTIAANLASYFAMRGLDVLLIDHDAQKSSYDWLASRPKGSIAIDVRVVSSPDLPIEPEKTQIIIHDTPAAWSIDKLISALHPGDRVLVPVLPSPTDIKACLRYVMNMYRFGALEQGIEVGLLANRVRKNTRMYRLLYSFLDELELPLVTSFRDSQNYVRAMEKGKSIFELPVSRVAEDVRQWQPLLEWLEAEILIQDYAKPEMMASFETAV